VPVVRISKGQVRPDQLAHAERVLVDSGVALRQPLEALDGLIHYYVGIDHELGYVTNVSVWETLEQAHQMDSLAPMLAQRPILEAAGVDFETITNHETLWTITP
jgi:hypothetical protein